MLALASRRSDVQHLNELIRTRLRQQGRLPQDGLRIETPAGRVGFAVGDQVLVTRNDHQRGVLNGTTGIVTATSTDALTFRTRDRRLVQVDRGWLTEGRLEHAYAMTIHKAQGRTVHSALLLGDNTLSAEAGYVGLSRGTHTNHLYLDSSPGHRIVQPCQPAPAWSTGPAAGRDRSPGLFSRSLQQQLAHERVQQVEGRSR